MAEYPTASGVIMTIGIVGLGLIGGSIAKAYREYAKEHSAEINIYGHDINTAIESFAMLEGTLNEKLSNENIGECDLIFIGLYPFAAVEYLKENAEKIKKDAYVIDLCGTKQKICEVGFALAKEYGFTFVGGHPMAGTHFSGYKYSRANMFKGAPMVIVPPKFDDIHFFDTIKALLTPAGFGKFSFTTAKDHDRMIAFTSQLAHVVSNAYVKSPTAKDHKGFSAGSYKDMTRVAWLNESMWTELFFDNKEPLLYELDVIIDALTEYKNALESGDREKMREILKDGRLAKEKIDG